MMQVKEAIILAGGLGTRLKPAVPDLPKCMAPVNGKPFISFVIRHFEKQGIERFIFSLGYMHDIIEDYLQNQFGNLSIEYSIEEEPLGTGGALRKACYKVKEKTAIVINGDTLFKVELNKMVLFFHMCGADCCIALKPMKDFDRYGVVEINKDYSVSGFKEKEWKAEGLINGGVYVLHARRFSEEALPDKFSFEKDWLEKYFDKRKIYGLPQDEYFIDIGLPSDYEKAQLEM